MTEPEVIVVDSGSTDRTLEIAGGFPVTIAHIDASDFSFGRSLNKGCALASGDILVFISAHCYPTYDDWLEKIAAPFEAPDVGVVYGKQRGGSSTNYSEHRLFQQWFPDDPDSDQRHAFCNNANCAVRRSRWLDHPYDEDLTGLEDLAWARGALDDGLRIVYEPEAEIIHIHDESPAGIYNRYRREAIAFQRIFPTEDFRLLDLLRLTSVSIWRDLVSAWADGELWRRWREVCLFRMMQYMGAYRGFKFSGKLESALKRKLYYPHPPRTEVDVHAESGRRKIPYLDLERLSR